MIFINARTNSNALFGQLILEIWQIDGSLEARAILYVHGVIGNTLKYLALGHGFASGLCLWVPYRHSFLSR